MKVKSEAANKGVVQPYGLPEAADGDLHLQGVTELVHLNALDAERHIPAVHRAAAALDVVMALNSLDGSVHSAAAVLLMAGVAWTALEAPQDAHLYICTPIAY